MRSALYHLYALYETHLRDDDQIGPPVFDAGRVERPRVHGHPGVRYGLGEDIAHTLARLEGAQLFDRRRPVGMGEQRTREDPRSCTDPVDVVELL